MSTSRLERVKQSTASVEGEETIYEHSKQKSHGGVNSGADSHSQSTVSNKKGFARNGWVMALVLFGVFWLFLFLSAIAWAPWCFVLRKKKSGCSSTDRCKRNWRRSNIDYGRTALWTLFAAVLLLILFWILSLLTASIVGAVWGSSGKSKSKSKTSFY